MKEALALARRAVVALEAIAQRLLELEARAAGDAMNAHGHVHSTPAVQDMHMVDMHDADPTAVGHPVKDANH